MSEMIKYEWKKIWKSRLAQLVIIGCGLFLVFCVWASIMQISATNEKGENFLKIRLLSLIPTTLILINNMTSRFVLQKRFSTAAR